MCGLIEKKITRELEYNIRSLKIVEKNLLVSSVTHNVRQTRSISTKRKTNYSISNKLHECIDQSKMSFSIK